ncbi:hypothetical protein [Sulfobacillus harzensis]|uniref:Uncharacterized protein n=1 Tax=Sulfobacillus harzensis TaxID=2729629 RepID=A0A7Y0Q526_9FIRM|nr:hypothetical protein [Sulfobacillus harzensis]NMP23824.1 hypothetical protein [Sulfobacillus harzensis]
MKNPVFWVCDPFTKTAWGRRLIERAMHRMPTTHIGWDRWERRQTWELSILTVAALAVDVWLSLITHPFIGWGFIGLMGFLTVLLGITARFWPRDYRIRSEPLFIADDEDACSMDNGEDHALESEHRQ